MRGGHGPTLLLVAGHPQTWYAWDDILPGLAKHYTVVAPDLPGSGGSDAPAGISAYTKKAMAGDLYQLLVKLGLDKNIRVVGHDTCRRRSTGSRPSGKTSRTTPSTRRPSSPCR